MAEAGWRLHGHLPQDRIQEVLNEAYSHFYDRTEGLIESGLDQSEAQSKAVAMFGSAKEWTTDIVHSSYSDHLTEQAGIVGACAAGLFLFTTALTPLLPLGCAQPIHYLAAATLAAGAFRARRWRPSRIAALALCAGVLSFVISGLVSVPVIPWVVAVPPASYHLMDKSIDTVSMEQDLNKRLLKIGMQTYAGQKPPSRIPPALLSGTRYIVPRPAANAKGFDAFKVLDVPQSTQIDYAANLLAAAPYRTVATKNEAASIWRTEGPRWQAIIKSQDGLSAISALMGLTGKRHGVFDLRTAVPGLLIILLNLPLLLLLERIAATAGRTASRRSRRNRPSIG